MTWNDLLALLTRPSATPFDMSQIYAWVNELQVSPSEITPYRHFTPDKYARNLIWKDDRLEVLCMCWEPGQQTRIHNHGGSYGVVYVLEGQLFNEEFQRLDQGELPGKARVEAAHRAIAIPGQVLASQVGDIHRIGNPESHEGRSVSLHFYGRPLQRIETFDRESGEVTEVLFAYDAPPSRLPLARPA